MKNILVFTVTALVIVLLAGTAALAQKPVVRQSVGVASDQVQSLCIEGHVFVVAASGTAVTATQVYELRKEGVVPKTCKPKQK